MFSKIVLALDGSDPSERVVPVARELAAPGSAQIDIVHVRELIAGRGGGQTLRANEDDLEHRVHGLAKELSDAGYDVHLHVETTVGGGPAQVIAQIAEKTGAEVILIGTRGHAPVAGLLLGSVTQRLLHIAPCPVLAVPELHTVERTASPDKIAVGA